MEREHHVEWAEQTSNDDSTPQRGKDESFQKVHHQRPVAARGPVEQPTRSNVAILRGELHKVGEQV